MNQFSLLAIVLSFLLPSPLSADFMATLNLDLTDYACSYSKDRKPCRKRCLYELPSDAPPMCKEGFEDREIFQRYCGNGIIEFHKNFAPAPLVAQYKDFQAALEPYFKPLNAFICKASRSQEYEFCTIDGNQQGKVYRSLPANELMAQETCDMGLNNGQPGYGCTEHCRLRCHYGVPDWSDFPKLRCRSCFLGWSGDYCDVSLCKNGRLRPRAEMELMALPTTLHVPRCECEPGWLGPYCNVTYCQGHSALGCTACLPGMANISNQCRDVACESFKPDPENNYQCTQRACSSLGYYGPQCRASNCLAREEEKAGEQDDKLYQYKVMRQAACTRCQLGWTGRDCLVSLCRYGERNLETGSCYQPCSEPGFYGSYCNKSNALFSVKKGLREFVRCLPGYQSQNETDCSILACTSGLADFGTEQLTCFHGSCFAGWTGSYCNESLCDTFNETAQQEQQIALEHWKVDHADFASWHRAMTEQALSGHGFVRTIPAGLPAFDFALELSKEQVCLLDLDERKTHTAQQRCQANGLWNGSHCQCFHGWEGNLCDIDRQAVAEQAAEQALGAAQHRLTGLQNSLGLLSDAIATLSALVQRKNESCLRQLDVAKRLAVEQALMRQSIINLESEQSSLAQQVYSATAQQAAIVDSMIHLQGRNACLTHRLCLLHEYAENLSQQLSAYKSSGSDLMRYIAQTNLSGLNYTDLAARSGDLQHWKYEADNMARCNPDVEALVPALRTEMRDMQQQICRLSDELGRAHNASAVMLRTVQSERESQADYERIHMNMSDRRARLELEKQAISTALHRLKLNLHNATAMQSLLAHNASALAANATEWQENTSQLEQKVELDTNATADTLDHAARMQETIHGLALQLAERATIGLMDRLLPTNQTELASSGLLAYFETHVQEPWSLQYQLALNHSHLVASAFAALEEAVNGVVDLLAQTTDILPLPIE